MKYRKILVAIDRSPQAEAVFEQALELAKKEKASLMIFHSSSLDTQIGRNYRGLFGTELVNYSAEMQAELQKAHEETREWLEVYGHRAIAQRVPTEWQLKVGDAGSTIREMVNDWGADLVVLGRRGHRGLEEMFLGSVSSYVIHHVSCSVLIVQGITASATDTSSL